MLRINLLPPYIYEGSKRRNVMILWTGILLVVIGGFVFGKITLDAKAAKIKADTETERPLMVEKQTKEKQASEIESANAALKTKTDFVKGTRKYVTDTYPPVFTNVRDYTIRRVVYSYLTPNQQQVQLGAYAPSLADVGHYLLAMQNNPNINSVDIGISSVPGFPVASNANGQNQGFNPFGRGGSDVRMNPGEGPSMMMSSMGSGRGPYGSGRSPFAGAGGGGGGGQTGNIIMPPSGVGHTFTITLNLKNPIPGAPTYGTGGGQQQGGGGFPTGPTMGGPPPGMSGPPGGRPGGMSGPPGGVPGAPDAGVGGKTGAD